MAHKSTGNYPEYSTCLSCSEKYKRTNPAQRRCRACQAAHEQAMATVYKKRHREKKNGNHNDKLERKMEFYIVVADPLQPDWHGKIPLMQVIEGCRLATFSEGTVLRRGRQRYIVVGATAPDPSTHAPPFGRAYTAQRLEEI